jgi:Fe-S-cluster containining protein
VTKKKPDKAHGVPAIKKKADPVVPPAARAVEKHIVSVLSKLVKQKHASCLDRGFRAGYAEVRNSFSEYQRMVLAGYPIAMTCGKECGVCCNHWPEDTYSFEVLLVADHLKNQHPADIKRIVLTLRDDIDCLDTIKKSVEQRLCAPRERKALRDIDPYDVALSSFYQFSRPCPLLGQNGSCTIYAIRPFTCRVYVSFSPPMLCRPENILGKDVLTYLLDLGKDAEELFDSLHFMYDVFDGDTSFRSMLYKALTADR